MLKPLLILLCLSLICWIIQLLPVISVPITPTTTNIYLSKYQNFTYGVFGICQNNICSNPRIGYPSVNSTFYSLTGDVGESTSAGVVLPSSVTYTISKLLVVHVMAFSFTSMLIIIISGLIMLQVYRKRKNQARRSNAGINLMLISTLFSFLTNLLGFLVDLLLFTPNLSYLGWLQLIPIVSMVLITTMLCFIKRTIVSRRFFENDEQTYHANDDMRMMRKNVIDRFYNDNASDDGFYVVTDGFYTRNNHDIRQSHTSEEYSLDSLHTR
ncbi:uncharacterized protein SPAPADRAFT_143440 [Spathaspora passalidarum NRRL Y-27907]|uniref:Pali-domain-containing protein n=1 Tax=Spathaspora passalidarum (strain NRRL Y-27907 / 11-Y1) TaxID=619300 RepID=G3ATT5_SPAPN|nr:uncharacterized protein SPAPADRAFT_143440 [Spathaspora passalidarum NRRL Y-27907]EGW30311.1 hypothetical protein SPAPADRAFT_143440 [Spathaspora passalidarum NRRL Y-27907]